MSVKDDPLAPKLLPREIRLGEFVAPSAGSQPPSLKSWRTPANRPAARSIKYLFQRGGYVALILNVCFFAFLAYWLRHNVEFADLALQLKQIPLHGILIAMTINLFVLLFYASRISTLLGGGLLSSLMIATMGFSFNALMPFRAGEGVKIYFGHSYYDYSIGGMSAAVLLEKLYDATAIVVVSLLILAASHASLVEPRILIAAAGAIFIVFCALLVLRRKGALWSLPESRFVKAARLNAFFKQAGLLVAGHSAARTAFITAAIWTTNVCLVYVVFKTLLPEIDVDVVHAMTILTIGALAIAVPSSPAGLGIFEAGIVAYLANTYGVQKERAISAALAYHFSITAPHTLIVVGFLGMALFRWLKERARLMTPSR